MKRAATIAVFVVGYGAAIAVMVALEQDDAPLWQVLLCSGAIGFLTGVAAKWMKDRFNGQR